MASTIVPFYPTMIGAHMLWKIYSYISRGPYKPEGCVAKNNEALESSLMKSYCPHCPHQAWLVQTRGGEDTQGIFGGVGVKRVTPC